MSVSSEKYTRVAVALHWVMAIAFILMLISGLAMTREGVLETSLQFKMFQWHKSLGVILLVAFFVRIGWRLFHKPPALPESFKPIEKLAGHTGHLALYALMIAMPITGWVMVSSSAIGLPTFVFGWFEWPHIPGLEGQEKINALSKNGHEYMGYGFIAVIGLHVAATIKHMIVEKENLMKRMSFSLVLGIALLFSVNVMAADIDYQKSEITFQGVHAEKEFEGTVGKWAADVTFDPENLNASQARVSFQMSSLKTGDKYYDSTLKSKDWLDYKAFPEAVFKSTAIEKIDDQTFKMIGVFTIKDIEKSLSFDFTYIPQSDGTALVEASFPIDRLAYDIGEASDPKAQWVSQNIDITLKLIQTP